MPVKIPLRFQVCNFQSTIIYRFYTGKCFFKKEVFVPQVVPLNLTISFDKKLRLNFLLFSPFTPIPCHIKLKHLVVICLNLSAIFSYSRKICLEINVAKAVSIISDTVFHPWMFLMFLSMIWILLHNLNIPRSH